jgi:uncharacterized protein
MRHISLKPILIFLAMLIPMLSGAVAVKDVENVHVKDRTRYVTDMAGMLSAEAVARADSLMADAWAQSSAEPVIVIVDNLDGEDIDDYATELFELWKPGKKDKDNGVILLISMEDKQFVIRTGYGVEGVLPDAICWTILNKTMKPYFKEGDYNAGVIAAAIDLNGALTSEEAREELRSQYANDADAGDDDATDLFYAYIIMCIVWMGGFLVFYFVQLYKSRGKDTVEAYRLFDKYRILMICLSIATLGIMLPVLVAWLLTMYRIRNKKRLCTNCHAVMHKLDEETDNLYLTPSQDTEEHLKSVDYDVWLCPECNQTEILPYINSVKNYTVCSRCGARAEVMTSERIVQQPTTRSEGKGVRSYTCLHCQNHSDRYFNIAKLATPPVVIIPGGRGGGFGGGGGFSGGSFGGGMTGGGGAHGGW